MVACVVKVPSPLPNKIGIVPSVRSETTRSAWPSPLKSLAGRNAVPCPPSRLPSHCSQTQLSAASRKSSQTLRMCLSEVRMFPIETRSVSLS